MKCIHCESDTKLKDRKTNGGRCAQCSHRFAFEPTTDPLKISDGLFQRCIKDVSGNGTLFFTEKQLWYEFNRRLLRKMVRIPIPFGVGAGACVAGGLIGIIAGTAVLLPVGLFAGIVTMVVGAQVGKKNPKPKRVAVSLEDFRSRYLLPYQSAHGNPEKLLPSIKPRPKFRKVFDDPAPEPPPDLESYSFDRALVTDHADTAAMLVANRFHFENNCAILSVDRRFPENGRFDTILQMLKNNPSLTVFAIHDTGINGESLPLTLRGADWFPDRSVRVVDLGLRRSQVTHGSFLTTDSAPLPVPPRVQQEASRLNAEVAAQIRQGIPEQGIVEIASLRPARLMRAIFQGFNQANAMPTGQGVDDGGVIIVGGPGYGGDVWVGDGGGSDVFAADSFG